MKNPRRRSRLAILSSLFAAGLAGSAGCNPSELGPDQPPAMTEAPRTPEDVLGLACATGTAPADRVPVYMLFILDGSGSMRQQGKWEAAVSALSGIFDDFAGQSSGAFGVGLTVFADRNDKTISDFWAGPYDKMDVPVAYVSAEQAQRLKARVMGTAPYLGTPTYEVLAGQLPALATFTPAAPLLPEGRRVAVFITDGVPDPDMPAGRNAVPWSLDLVGKYAQGKGGPVGQAHPAINTFVIGVGPFPGAAPDVYSPTFLGDLAVAGGTRQAATCDPHEQMSEAGLCYLQITPPQTGTPSKEEIDRLTARFVSAIDKVRGDAALCEYTLKRADNDFMLDPANINVYYTDDKGQKTLIPKSDSAGWSYDDPRDPKRVLLHGASCDRVKADKGGKVTIIVGCASIVLP